MSYYYGSSPSSTSSQGYSYSRPSSVSPQFSNAYLYTSGARFNASRGFDPEDDMEFCPALSARKAAPSSVPEASMGSYVSSDSHETVVTTPVRTRKAIEIVDPTTGLRVSRD
uniref:ARAD1C45584p n=1 Tax=Blastobotrys adeninivorans TaxID=409370 RepID=A0A060T9L1_BLAAD